MSLLFSSRPEIDGHFQYIFFNNRKLVFSQNSFHQNSIIMFNNNSNQRHHPTTLHLLRVGPATRVTTHFNLTQTQHSQDRAINVMAIR